eukprot:5578423-Alexandrium_andersonii.AAC.1
MVGKPARPKSPFPAGPMCAALPGTGNPLAHWWGNPLARSHHSSRPNVCRAARDGQPTRPP